MHSQPREQDLSSLCTYCLHPVRLHSKDLENWCGTCCIEDCGCRINIQSKAAIRGLPDNKDWADDPVSHPKHYTEHPSGIECIQITEHMNYCLGNAVKYIWRAGLKSDDPIQDLEKSVWYVQREIQRLKSASTS